jgi:hypothetical protein
MRQQNHASPKRGISKMKLQASAAFDPKPCNLKPANTPEIAPPSTP